MKRTTKPVIGLTLGDPAGIGPELAFHLIGKGFFSGANILLIADRDVLERLAVILKKRIRFNAVEDPADGIFRPDSVNYFQVRTPVAAGKFELGRPDRRTALLSHAFIVAAAELALKGKISAIVTNPVSKERIVDAGVKSFVGHTELFAGLAGVRKFNMVFACAKGIVGLVTTHCGLKEVPGRITLRNVSDSLMNLGRNSGRILGGKPSIAVLALNPHAGEAGLFGKEEGSAIIPAIRSCRLKGVAAEGPFPADSFWPRVWPSGKFNTVLAMYHDQGLIPVKAGLLGPAVNVTLGLPFIRTSVDHGTAYAIAGKKLADPSGLVLAVKYAVKLSGRARKKSWN